MKTVVVGSGGREHAIAWALARSERVSEVLCVPGNGGTAVEPKCRNIDIPVSDFLAITNACRAELSSAEDFVVIGPEDPLAAGLSDRLAAAGFRVVGPRQKPAALEASKDAAKRFMSKYGVACAESETFSNADDASAALKTGSGPVVVKADGLAAGKGVVVAADRATAEKAVREFMIEGSLGGAGHRVVLEEYLEGDEISVLAAVSVTPETASAGRASIRPFVSARDHKRLRDGATGPNTGGMGAIAPVPGLDEATLARFRTDILEPTLRGLVAEGYDYRGFIFFGLMLTTSGPKLLEYNVRLGDPETQAVLPLMDFDFAGMCEAIMDGTLADFPLAWQAGFCCAPVAVSGGYPGEYRKGIPLAIDRDLVAGSGAKVFVAGAKVDRRAPKGGKDGAGLVTAGGRVLAASARGDSIEEARERAYRALAACSFEGMFYRRDIGLPGAAASPAL